MKRRPVIYIAVIASLFINIFVVSFPKSASAASCPASGPLFGRSLYCGYFSNVNNNGTKLSFLIDEGLFKSTDANSFIAEITGYLNTNIGACPAVGTMSGPDNSLETNNCRNKKKRIVGAAFIINSMLGYNGSKFAGVLDGVNNAKAQLPLWSQYIQYYGSQPPGSSNGWVEWKINLSRPAKENDWISSDSGYDAFPSYIATKSSADDFIVFHNPKSSGSTTYRIIIKCANVDGTPTPLTPPPVSVDLKVNGSDGPLAINQGNSINISWTSINMQVGYTCTASSAGTIPGTTWTGGRPPQNIPGENHDPDSAAPGNGKTYTINCTGPLGDTFDSVKVDVIPPISPTGKPYFQLIGGDIASGFGPPTTCPGWGSSGPGTITAWNNGLGAGNKGAGTNLAAFALDVIKGFASAQPGPPTTGSPPPAGLSFANIGSPPVDPTFGGGFQGGISCPADYFGTKPATVSFVPFPGPTTSDAYFSGIGVDVTLGAFIITSGQRPIVYVDGDAYIDNDIMIDDAGVTSISDLSNFWLVVKGNIYIAHTVTRLDGVYVAQPVLVDSNGDGDFNDPGESTKGKIYTCYGALKNPSASPPTPTMPPARVDLAVSCGTVPTLTVNGAFIAKELKLYRSGGSMSTGNPAELFNYTPSVWLAPPPPIVNNKTSDSYEAITNLPPVL